MTERNRILLPGVLAICIAAVLWGLDGIVFTPRLYNLPVPLVVFLLHIIPFTLMNIFLWRNYRLLKTLRRRDYIYMFLVSLFGGALGTLSIVKALFLVNFQSLTVVVLLQKLQPVFGIALAAILLKEKLRNNYLLWAAVAIIAGYFLTFGVSLPDFGTGKNTALAAAFSVLAAFSFGSSTVFGRGLVTQIPFHAATFFRYGLTSLIMLLIVLVTGTLQAISEVTPQNWLFIGLIVATTGSGAIFLYYYGLKKTPAMIATICELCFPLSAVLFDYLLHGKILSPIQWISAAVMLFAIVKLSTSKAKS